LNKFFIFLRPSHNFRSTEINAVLGLSQIKKLDDNNSIRKKNFEYFIQNLSSDKYITDLNIEGQCNYALIIILKEGSFRNRDIIERTLSENGIEFRRGLSGGGNQLRQPFMRQNYNFDYDDFPNIEHIHNFSWYVGNYPTLDKNKIDFLVNILNNVQW
jgi:CDP-6-deoxy-D-xylo-4-hexulose-3-dehydrase